MNVPRRAVQPQGTGLGSRNFDFVGLGSSVRPLVSGMPLGSSQRLRWRRHGVKDVASAAALRLCYNDTMAQASPTVDQPSIDSLPNSPEFQRFLRNFLGSSTSQNLAAQQPDVVPAAHITLGLASTNAAAESRSWTCWPVPGLTEGEA